MLKPIKNSVDEQQEILQTQSTDLVNFRDLSLLRRQVARHLLRRGAKYQIFESEIFHSGSVKKFLVCMDTIDPPSASRGAHRRSKESCDCNRKFFQLTKKYPSLYS